MTSKGTRTRLSEDNPDLDVVQLELNAQKDKEREAISFSLPDNEFRKNVTEGNSNGLDQSLEFSAGILHKLNNSAHQILPIFQCGNVKLYFIQLNGEVKSTFEEQRLTIFTVDGDPEETIFLQVGTWVYPLFTAISPCYRSESNVFIFPDIYADEEGATVALIAPKTECETLHELLTELLEIKENRTRRSIVDGTSGTVSDNVNKGSSYLARNLIRASTNLAGYLDAATSGVINKIEPQPIDSINPSLTNAVHVAERVSGNAASMTGYLSSNLGKAVTYLGKYISPYISKTISEAVPPSAVHFTVNTLHGIGNIYNGLEESALILTRSLSNNAVKLAEHRYGQPAGHITSDVLSTVGNIYAARRNLGVWKPKSLAKATLKSAGRAILEDHQS